MSDMSWLPALVEPEMGGGGGGNCDCVGIDGLKYDEETRKLWLTADGETVGEAVTIPSDDYADSFEDTWSDMTEPTEDDGETEWENM